MNDFITEINNPYTYKSVHYRSHSNTLFIIEWKWNYIHIGKLTYGACLVTNTACTTPLGLVTYHSKDVISDIELINRLCVCTINVLYIVIYSMWWNTTLPFHNTLLNQSTLSVYTRTPICILIFRIITHDMTKILINNWYINTVKQFFFTNIVFQHISFKY